MLYFHVVITSFSYDYMNDIQYLILIIINVLNRFCMIVTQFLCFQYTYWMTLIQIGGRDTTKEERDCSQLTLSRLTCQQRQISLVSNHISIMKIRITKIDPYEDTLLGEILFITRDNKCP